MRLVEGYPGGVARLLLFVLDMVDQAWEVSYVFRPLRDTLAGAEDCVQRNAGLIVEFGDESRATKAVLELLESLSAQICTEDAMVSGLPRERAEAADRAVRHAQAAIEAINPVSQEYSDIRDRIIGYAEQRSCCYEAIALAARTLIAFYETGNSLERAIERIRRIESRTAEIADESLISEVRAERFSLMELQGRLDSEWMRVDQGKMIYIYPFATRGIKPERAAQESRSKARDWSLAGVRPPEVHNNLELDDIWAAGSNLSKRRYAGCFIKLPDVVVGGQRGERYYMLHAGIVLSALGNHHVRFEVELNSVSAECLHAMMFRAAPESGEMALSFSTCTESDNDQPLAWPRLSDLAADLIWDLGERLLPNPNQGRRPLGNRTVISRPGLYYVFVSIGAASTTRGPATERKEASEVTTTDQLRNAVGVQLLMNPIPSVVGSAGEWVRYSRPKDLLELTGPAGEWVVKTCNTACLVTLGLPDFLRGTWGSLVEFVISLDGLFEGWANELARHYEKSDEFDDEWSKLERKKATAAELSDLSDEMSAERRNLDTFTVELHYTTGLLSSPALVSSPHAADALQSLLQMSGFYRKVDKFFRGIERLSHERLGGTIEKLAQQQAEQEKAKQAAKVSAILAIIAALGIAGLGEILQTGFGMDEWPTIWIVLAVIIIGVAAGFIVHYWELMKISTRRGRGRNDTG
ncbi:hypothetical protein [Streptomyces sp. SP18BB07]|uniref:hypothetical protein n=1 Tax=Streptomyces sp. SP18BB07 TaxID=3002522 RepID=UPI002E7983E0|nr:hypothetical protein [Streptomyces sp. SP18BB07]MEE1763022.1 hypothetical protein [Streptomyces sp. SP18BB07]